MTEREIRNSEENRDELRRVITSGIFRAALGIIITKRRVLETKFEVGNLNGEALQSLRLFNQRLGMEDMILQLHELCTHIPEGPPEDAPSTFGREAEYMKLQELYDAQNL